MSAPADEGVAKLRAALRVLGRGAAWCRRFLCVDADGAPVSFAGDERAVAYSLVGALRATWQRVAPMTPADCDLHRELLGELAVAAIAAKPGLFPPSVLHHIEKRKGRDAQTTVDYAFIVHRFEDAARDFGEVEALVTRVARARLAGGLAA